MVGKSSEAQQLTIYILTKMDPVRMKVIFDDARERMGDNLPAKEQLELCVLMADEMRENPAKYDDIENLIRTIASRKLGIDIERITIRETMAELGYDEEKNNNRVYYHIVSNSQKIRPDQVETLCDGFVYGSNRLFWKNQIYGKLSYLPMEDTIDGPVLLCLRAVWDSLCEKERTMFEKELPQYQEWFKKKLVSCQENPLYDILEAAQKEKKEKTGKYMSKQAMISCTNIKDVKTWDYYKKEWKAYACNGGVSGFPRNRLLKDQLLELAILMDMDYDTMVHMMDVAGYSFQTTESDRDIMQYFLDNGQKRQ